MGFKSLVSGREAKTKYVVALGKEQRGWKGILARVKERLPKRGVSGKSHPKLGRHMTDRAWVAQPQRIGREIQFLRGTESQSGMREGWDRLPF